MNTFVSLFGKFVLVAVILGGIAYGAYYLGVSSAPAKESGAATTTAAPTPTIDPGLIPESLPEGYVPSQTVTAGLGPESGLSFTKYLLIVPGDWTADHTTTNEGTWADTLILTKGAYQIKIFQAATGGAACLFPGDADVEGPSSRYTVFKDITSADGISLRRGSSGSNPSGYTICQKQNDLWGAPTVFGHISLKTPRTPEPEILSQIDTMLSSIKRIP